MFRFGQWRRHSVIHLAQVEVSGMSENEIARREKWELMRMRPPLCLLEQGLVQRLASAWTRSREKGIHLCWEVPLRRQMGEGRCEHGRLGLLVR